MKILVVADIHGDISSLGRVLSAAPEADVVVCPGNVTDMFKTPQEFSQLDVADMVIQRLLSLNKPLLCVPGNHDPPEILDIFEEYKTNLHHKKTTVAGLQFGGFGGAKTPFHTLFEPSEEETGAALASLGDMNVLVAHNPPKNTKNDRLKNGTHVGSLAVRKYIETHQPQLVITSHIHEAAGTDTIGKTTIYNPGPTFQGRYGIVTITKNNVVCTSHTC